MGKLNGVPGFHDTGVDFLKNHVRSPTNFVTSIRLETMGDAVADVITLLPYWQKDFARSTFELVIKIALTRKQLENYREDYDLLLGELRETFKKISVRKAEGVIDISIADAVLPANQSSKAEAYHNAAIAILLRH